MGILARALSQKSVGGYDLISELIGRRESATGKVVSVKSAIEVATVFACMRVIGNGIAQVPFKLMKESADGKVRLPAKEHSLYDILQNRPNEWQTSFEYREMLAMHLVLCGNHYSFINRSNRSGVMELIPFDPGSVMVTRNDDYSLTYKVTGQSGSVQEFPAKSIWHVRGPSWNGWYGLEAVQLAREAIGLSMAIEEQQAKMQKNGAKVSGTYAVEGALSKQQYQDLRAWVEKEVSGLDNSGRVMVMDRSAKWLNTSMSGIDAQTLETRRYQVEEICRFFLVNPIMVGAESKNTTYASAEQMFLAHVVHCLSPLYQRIEQSANANLLTEAERKEGYYTNFVDAGLLRGSSKDRAEYYAKALGSGGSPAWMSQDEVRSLEDMNPFGGTAEKLPISMTSQANQGATP